MAPLLMRMEGTVPAHLCFCFSGSYEDFHLGMMKTTMEYNDNVILMMTERKRMIATGNDEVDDVDDGDAGGGDAGDGIR